MKLPLAALISTLAAVPLAATTLPLPPTSAPPAPPRPQTPVTPDMQKRADIRDYGASAMGAFVMQGRQIAQRAGFSGEFGVGYQHGTDLGDTGPTVMVSAQDAKGKLRQAGGLWRWASVTKQVIAVLVMQEAATGRIDLDAPLAMYLPGFASPNADKMTVRQLLRHQSGLPNPTDTPAGPDGVPDYYRPDYKGNRDPLTGYCAGVAKGEPSGRWEYNNCDYIVAGALLEAVTGKPWRILLDERIAKPFNLTTLSSYPSNVETAAGYSGGKPEPDFDLASYDSAAALYGSAIDLLKFDVNLMKGRLLHQTILDEMWDGRPELGSIALGQWAFEAPLKGCAKPDRIIERRGAIGGIQVRNFMLPEKEIAVALFSDQGEGDFDFGEIWQGSGFAYDMLSLAGCAKEATA